MKRIILSILILILSIIGVNGQTFPLTKRSALLEGGSVLSVVSIKTQTYPIAKRSAILNEGVIKVGDKEVLIKNEYEDIKIIITNKSTKRLFGGFKGIINGVDESNNKYTLTVMKNQIHLVSDIWNTKLNKFENKIVVYDIEGNDISIPEKETKDEQ
jgi:hypothetical protein